LLGLGIESLLVAVAGVSLAFAANTLSPRGLSLSRNYFPTGHPNVPVASGSSIATHSTNSASSGAAVMAALAAQLHQEGLGLAESNQVVKLFHDPRTAQGLVLFIDARDDEHFQNGHIPGSYQLDFYRPGPYLPTVLPVCSTAEEIVVYCNGGDCEDSKHTAMFLRDAGVPANKLLVYAGGMEEWTANRMPVETGERNSGKLLANQKAAP